MSGINLWYWTIWIKEKIFCQKLRRYLISSNRLRTFHVWRRISVGYHQRKPIFWIFAWVHHFLLHFWQLRKKKNHDVFIGTWYFRHHCHCFRVQHYNDIDWNGNVRSWDQRIRRDAFLFSWWSCVEFKKAKILGNDSSWIQHCGNNNDRFVLFYWKLEDYFYFSNNFTCNRSILFLHSLHLRDS